MSLRAHPTGALENLLGERIVAREPMHAWPLSSVESLTTASGKRFVYKVQREPTVEPEFFARAQTPLLPPCRVLARDAEGAALLFPFLPAPTLRDAGLDEGAFVAQGRALVRQIGGIGGDVPVYVDVGTIANWRGFAEKTLGMLSALVGAGIFTLIDREDIGVLARWTEARGVLDAIDQTSQLIHGDLKAEHVFCVEDGYRIIDWQRPYRAPGDIDLVHLLESRQISASRHVDPAVIGLRWFLFVHWAAEAKTRLLPDLPFFDRWARAGIDAIRSTL